MTTRDFGAVLRIRQAELLRTNEDCARELGITRQTWHRWKAGHAVPGRTALVLNVADWLEMPGSEVWPLIEAELRKQRTKAA